VCGFTSNRDQSLGVRKMTKLVYGSVGMLYAISARNVQFHDKMPIK
jgi:hypothetical protein